MIQGGNPSGDGTGGQGYSIAGEFESNGFNNDLKHTRGVISMTRTENDPNSAGSQFFITVNESPQLAGNYATFGEVFEGIDTVDNIVAVECIDDDTHKPVKDQVIKQIEVDTKGFEADEPEMKL